MICLDVINTMWYDYRGTGKSEDRLENKQWVKRFMVDWQLAELDYPKKETIQLLQSLRQLMRNIIEKTTVGKQPSSKDLEQLNQFIHFSGEKMLLTHSDEKFGFEIHTNRADWSSFISDVAFSFAQLFIDGSYKKVKICQNEDCKWVFFDTTKNGKKHWCSSDTCGNLHRVRKHRSADK